MKNKVIAFILILISISLGLIIYNFNFKYENISIEEMTEKDINFNNKPNIYMFWGKGCKHCEELNKFLMKNKKYFNLYTFEIWYNEDNKKLMDLFLENLGEDYGGVPYLVIGNKSFLGFTSNDKKELKKYIKEEYNKKIHVDIYKKIKELN